VEDDDVAGSSAVGHEGRWRVGEWFGRQEG